MKFLLAAINAKYIHSNPGVYSLRAFARTKIPGADIEIGEYTINHQMDLILQDIYRRKPDFIGFSCYIWNISYINGDRPGHKESAAGGGDLAWRSGGVL